LAAWACAFSTLLISGCTTPLLLRPTAPAATQNVSAKKDVTATQTVPSETETEQRAATDPENRGASGADALETNEKADVVEVESKALQEALIAISRLAIEQRAKQAEPPVSPTDQWRHSAQHTDSATATSAATLVPRTSHPRYADRYSALADAHRRDNFFPPHHDGAAEGPGSVNEYAHAETIHVGYPETPHAADLFPRQSPSAASQPIDRRPGEAAEAVNPTGDVPSESVHRAADVSGPNSSGRPNRLRPGTSGEAARLPQDAAQSENEGTENPPTESHRTPQEAIEAAIQLLREKLKESSHDEQSTARTREEVALRLLRMASMREKDRQEAAAAIKHLGVDEAEFWQDVLFAIKELQDESTGATVAQRASGALASLRRAEAALSNLGMLEVRNLKFCSSVRSFGRFEEFPEMQFFPGQQVIVYAEVYNFMSQAKAGGYETALESRYEIYDAEGNQVDLRKFGVERELCASRRRDFYFPYKINLPSNLMPGRYRLTLTIKDALANKFDQQSIDFIISTNR
jgi:hypothetical protein